jgi:hypothetical protein
MAFILGSGASPGQGAARLTVLAGLAALGLGAPARATTLTADYGIWLAGIPFGSAQMTTAVEGEAYKLQLEARLTGLAGVLTSGRGGATANGALGGARPNAAAFAVLTRSSNAQVAISVALAQGNVTKVDIEPPAEPKPDRVPLADAHKRGVIDPLSALVMPVVRRSEPLDAANCDRTVPVFDGWTRFDIALSFAETRNVDGAGYRGPVLVCNVRYTPIAGHRAERPATRFMAENRDISVWLAPVAGTRVLVPWRISVKTTLGTNVIEATKWTLDGGVVPAAAKPDKSR